MTDADRQEFEKWFGSDEEFALEMERQRLIDDCRERECQAGTRARCSCGAPSIFTHEKRGPKCAPCGYAFADFEDAGLDISLRSSPE